MAVVGNAEAFWELVDRDAEVERLATGFTFTEGPVWSPREECVYFSDMPADVRRRWSATGGVVEVMKPANKCNGMTYDGEGNLIVCEHWTSSVVRERPGGEREPIASHYAGRELNSPNDVVVRSDGSVYFSDPTYGRMPGFGNPRDQDLDFQGVYRIPPGGGDVQLLADDYGQPNGLCFSPDESLLYVNDTDRAHIRVYDVRPDGSIANSRFLIENVGTASLEKGDLVDGMKCDERGNVWVTGPGGIWVITPQGEHLGTIEIPEPVGNHAWGGRDWNDLYVTASTSLYRVRTRVPSRREPYMSL